MAAAVHRPDPLSVWRALSGIKPGLIAVYGAGGKTSLLERLAREAAAAGRETVLTTTTRIYPPGRIGLVLGKTRPELEAALRLRLAREGVAALGSGLLPEGKLSGLEPAVLERLQGIFPGAVFLVEADGAAGRSLKGHAPHEPVLPPSSKLILPVLGLSALGSPAGPETVHRPEYLLPAVGISPGETLGAAHLIRAMLYLVRRGLEQAPEAEVIPVFNQADRVTGAEAEMLRLTCAGLSDCPRVKRFIYTALREDPPVRFILEREGHTGRFAAPVCGVILAAGLSERMGCDKLALPFRGKAVLEHTVERAAAGGLREAVVVVRPDSPWRERLASRPGVRVVPNPRFREGIASSLQAGLAAAAAGNQAAIFALGDQPLVSPAVYRAILEAYRNGFTPVVYPLYRGRRGNPVLFDRRTWPRLLQLQGDIGGRQILPLLDPAAVAAVELEDPAVCMDLDNRNDYRRLLEQEKP